MTRNRPTLHRAALIDDGGRVRAGPGAILVENGRIRASGTPAEIGTPSQANVVDLPDAVLMPALVNAHCHLDLSHIGPIERSGPFTDWVEVIRQRRGRTAAEIAASVRRGIDLARAGGTAIIGDIAGVMSTVPLATLREAGLPGVSFIEVFGQGRRQTAAIGFMNDVMERIDPFSDGVQLGLQPHSPYSCGPDVFRFAAQSGLPLSTHLAETLEEIEFTRSGQGPLADLLHRLGVWDETISATGLHPIDYLAGILQETHCVAAHLNYIDESHLDLLARGNVSIAYCPRASAYFGHPQADQPPHQYRQMLKRGLNVALGTDSLVCLDTPDRISVLDELSFLHRRDGADPRALLRMATVAGARALGFDESLVTLEPGQTAGIIAVRSASPLAGSDPLAEVLSSSDARIEWVVRPGSHSPVMAPA